MGGKMNTETNTIAIPRKVFREIRWYLKHFNDLDDYIKTRENLHIGDRIGYWTIEYVCKSELIIKGIIGGE